MSNPSDAGLSVIELQLHDIRRRLDRLEARAGLPAAPEHGRRAADEVPAAAVVAARARPPGERSQRGATNSADQSAAAGFRVERLIGGRFFAAAGALIVVIGVGLFLHLAYTWGWFALSGAAKCGLAAGFGAVLLVLGEMARRRINSAAAAGLSAAGIGTLLGTVYAAHSVYHLLGTGAAFGLMAAGAVLGAFVAWAGALPLVGVVAVLGAYAAPVLVGARGAHPSALFCYVGAVLAMGLWMAWRLAPRNPWFGLVRAVASAGGLFLWMVYALGPGLHHPGVSLTFIVAVALVVHAELVLTARRIDAGPTPSPQSQTPEPISWPVLPGADRFARGVEESAGRTALMSVAVVAWGVWLAVKLAAHHWGWYDWLPAALATLACAAGATALVKHPRELFNAPTDVTHGLAAALAGQAAGMLIVTVLLSLEGPWRWLVWLGLGLGLGAALAGRLARARAVEFYGVGLLALGTARVGLEQAFGVPSPTWHWPLGGLVFDEHGTALLAAAAAWLAAARVSVFRHGPAMRPLGAAEAGVGVGLAIAATALSVGHNGAAWLAPAWLVIGVFAVVASRVEGRVRLDVIGLISIALAALPWALHAAGEYGAWTGAPLTHPLMWTGLAVSAALGFCGTRMLRSVTDPGTRRAAARAAAWTAGLVAFAASSAEVARASAWLTDDVSVRGAALSVYWAALGAALVVAGFAARLPGLRYAALALMGVAAVKVLVVDLADVGQGWRTASFLLVGVLMIAVAVVYARVAKWSDPAGA